MLIYIVGVVVSIVVELVKRQFGTSGWQSMGILLALAVVAAGGYEYLTAAGYWPLIAKVLITAGAFYAFVIQTMKNGVSPDTPSTLG